MSSPSVPTALAADLGRDAPTLRLAGHVLAMFAFDVGLRIDLEVAAGRVEGAARPRFIRGRRRAPVWFDEDPAPLHLVVAGEPVTVHGDVRTEADASVTLHAFGGATVTYRLPLPPDETGLPVLTAALHEHAVLEADARRRLEQLVGGLGPAIERPAIDAAVEDYVVVCITGWEPAADGSVLPRTAAEFLETRRALVARTIEAETGALSAEQVERSTAARMSYGPDDLAVVDWNAAVLVDPEPDDVVAVLQHANLELLELRILDQTLDRIIASADEALDTLMVRRLWPAFAERRLLGEVAGAQSDAAVGFEGLHNAIKLVGTQYLARLHRLAAEQLGLPEWEAGVRRKLEAGEALYAKMSDTAGTRRLEILEWVIIILIAISIVLPFTPAY